MLYHGQTERIKHKSRKTKGHVRYEGCSILYGFHCCGKRCSNPNFFILVNKWGDGICITPGFPVANPKIRQWFYTVGEMGVTVKTATLEFVTMCNLPYHSIHYIIKTRMLCQHCVVLLW